MGFVGQARGRKLVAELSAMGIGEATQLGEFPPRRGPWFLDNEVFKRWRKGLPFDHGHFAATMERVCAYRPDPLWVTLPDVVADGAASLALSAGYLPGLKALRYRVALVVQDGMTPETLPLWGDVDVIFVGGSLEWKLANAHLWCRAARERGLHCHIGRVGSAKRVRWARSICADSVDSCVPLWSAANLRNWSGALLDATPDQLAFGFTPPHARTLNRAGVA